MATSGISRGILLISFFLCIQFSLSLSQVNTLPPDYIVELITEEDGISSATANCFLRDRHGFMWIGTTRGLNRYDAYNFKSYFHQENDSTSLSDDYILCMCEDQDGMIWIGTMYGGLNKYDPAADAFTHYPGNREDRFQLRNSQIAAVCMDMTGDLWFAAHLSHIQSIYKIDRQREEIQCITHDHKNPNLPAFIHSHVIVRDSDNNMWIGSKEGLLKYDSLNKRLTQFRLQAYKQNENSREVLSIYEDIDGTFWIGTFGGGLYQFNRENSSFHRFMHETGHPDSLSSRHITAITDNKMGTLIIRTHMGIDFLNKQSGQLTSRKFPRLGRQVEWFPLTSIYWDNSGVLWFSVPKQRSVPAGIYKLSLKRKDFIHYTPEQLQIVNPEINWISSILQDNSGDVWAGGAPMELTRISNSQTPISFEHFLSDSEDPYGFISNDISAIYQDRAGALWIGSWSNGALNKLDFSDNGIENICYAPEDSFHGRKPYIPGENFTIIEDHPFTGGGSMRIHEDRGGKLWIARGTGLEIFDPAKGDFYPVDFCPEHNENLNLPVITSIAEDKSGSIWIGTMHQGLFKLSPPFTLDSSGQATISKTVSYRFDKDVPKELGDLMITSLCVPRIHEEVDVWIGTRGAGFFGLSRKKDSDNKLSEQLVHYSSYEGLCDDVVYGILEDGQGMLWLSTENGLSKFNPQTKIFRAYTEGDGMSIQHFHWLSSHKGKDGTLFFGGDKGLLTFHPESISDNPYAPPLVITGLEIFNKPVPTADDSPLQKSIIETTEIELTYNQNLSW